MRRKFSVVLAVIMVLVLSLGMVACGKKAEEPTSEGGGVVGLSMPTKSLQRWNQDGDNLKAQLEAKGYTVDIQYADGAQVNDVPTQVSQIENMITKGCNIIVVAAIDGQALTDVLQQAADASIPVIAYDRLIRDTANITYYTSFDNYKVGVTQAQYLIDSFDLNNAAGPFNMEIFGGSPDDNNARLFYQGAFDTIKPFIDSGKVVVKSGQTEFEKVAITGWKSETAQARMDNLLTANYADGTKLDMVLSPNDSIALGVVASFDNNGYGAADKAYPALTGQDCDVANVVNMINGKQSADIYKDTRVLAAKAVEMVDAILKGGEPEINNTTDYDNGVFVVPSYLCDVTAATKDNVKTLLLDSGYYQGADAELIKKALGL